MSSSASAAPTRYEHETAVLLLYIEAADTACRAAHRGTGSFPPSLALTAAIAKLLATSTERRLKHDEILPGLLVCEGVTGVLELWHACLPRGGSPAEIRQLLGAEQFFQLIPLAEDAGSSTTSGGTGALTITLDPESVRTTGTGILLEIATRMWPPSSSLEGWLRCEAARVIMKGHMMGEEPFTMQLPVLGAEAHISACSACAFCA